MGRDAYKTEVTSEPDHFVHNHQTKIMTEFLRLNKDGAVILDRTDEAEHVAAAISKKGRHQVQTLEEVRAEARRTLLQKKMPINVKTVSIL